MFSKLSAELKEHMGLIAIGGVVLAGGFILYSRNQVADTLGIDPSTLTGGLNKLGFLSKLSGGGSNLAALLGNIGNLILPPPSSPGADTNNGSGTDIASITDPGGNSSAVDSFASALNNFYTAPTYNYVAPQDNSPAASGNFAVGGGLPIAGYEEVPAVGQPGAPTDGSAPTPFIDPPAYASGQVPDSTWQNLGQNPDTYVPPYNAAQNS